MADAVKSPDDVKAAPLAPKPLRSAEQAALTRHVDNFKAPDDEEEAAREAEADISGMDLPKTAKATHKLMQEILAQEPKDQDEAKVKRAKLSKVRAHLTELEQGTQPAPLPMTAYRSIFSAQSDHANILRLNELSRTHPEVKALLDERDALAKQISELTKKPA